MGLKPDLTTPNLQIWLKDIISFCVTEAKLDRYDTIYLTGYTFLHQHRRQKCFHTSGGMGICLSVVDHESDYIFLIRLAFTKTDEDVYYGFTYVPPSDSRFRNADELEQFELEITNMCISHKYVYLIGAFNARTGSSQEYLCADDELARIFE